MEHAAWVTAVRWVRSKKDRAPGRRARAPTAPRKIRNHVYLANRRVHMTPLHHMSLVCSATTASDVAKHHEAIDGCLGELLGE